MVADWAAAAGGRTSWADAVALLSRSPAQSHSQSHSSSSSTGSVLRTTAQITRSGTSPRVAGRRNGDLESVRANGRRAVQPLTSPTPGATPTMDDRA
jgi:hypothetical protein